MELKAERVAAGQGSNPISISSVLGKPDEIIPTSIEMQQRRLVRMYLVPPATAATLAYLAYGGGAA